MTPPTNLPDVDQETLHSHFTYLYKKRFITGKFPSKTGMDKIVRGLVEPKLTRKGIEFIKAADAKRSKEPTDSKLGLHVGGS